MKRLEQHEAEAVVVSCMDFRFNDGFEVAISKLGVKKFDTLKLAGGARNLTSGEEKGRRGAIIADIKIAVDKHHVKKIVILNHENCGKYAMLGKKFTDMAKEAEFHKKELANAVRNTARLFKKVEVVAGFLRVNKNDDKLKIELVKI